MTNNATIATRGHANVTLFHTTVSYNHSSVNMTLSDPGSRYINSTNKEYPMHGPESPMEVSTSATVGLAVGAAVIVLVIVVSIVFWYRKHRQKTRKKLWEDNLTLSYIDSNIDLTKDNADEMISLDNDSFLNSLVNQPQQCNNPWSPTGTTKQYTYTYF